MPWRRHGEERRKRIMADQAASKAVAIAEEYKGHIEAAGMETWAARQVARDARAT
jgi:hypothetical protein